MERVEKHDSTYWVLTECGRIERGHVLRERDAEAARDDDVSGVLAEEHDVSEGTADRDLLFVSASFDVDYVQALALQRRLLEGIHDSRKVSGTILRHSDIVRKRCCWLCLEKVSTLLETNPIRDVFTVVGIEEASSSMVIAGLVVAELASGPQLEIVSEFRKRIDKRERNAEKLVRIGADSLHRSGHTVHFLQRIDAGGVELHGRREARLNVVERILEVGSGIQGFDHGCHLLRCGGEHIEADLDTVGVFRGLGLHDSQARLVQALGGRRRRRLGENLRIRVGGVAKRVAAGLRVLSGRASSRHGHGHWCGLQGVVGVTTASLHTDCYRDDDGEQNGDHGDRGYENHHAFAPSSIGFIQPRGGPFVQRLLILPAMPHHRD